MPEPRHDDETLMAYVDGELPTDEARQVSEALRADPEAAARVALFKATRQRLRESSVADASPVKDEIVQRIRTLSHEQQGRQTTRVIPFRRAAGVWTPAALAASVALIVGASLGYAIGTLPRDVGMMASIVVDEGWRQALDGLPSGESRDLPDGRLTAVASFRDGSGRLCREVEHRPAAQERTIAVLCHGTGEWRLRLRVATGGSDGGDYEAASIHGAVDAFLNATRAGEPLRRDEEAAALKALR